MFASDDAAKLAADEYFMQLAIEQAKVAQAAGEVPVGAVIVDANAQVVAVGENSVLRCHDPSAHAEIVAMRKAGQSLHNYRLPGLTLYVTLEPCTMCLGALFHARVSRVVYGASDPKTGACGGRLNLIEPGLINFHCEVEGGVLADVCGKLLSDFFKSRRLTAKSANKGQYEQ